MSAHSWADLIREKEKQTPSTQDVMEPLLSLFGGYQHVLVKGRMAWIRSL